MSLGYAGLIGPSESGFDSAVFSVDADHSPQVANIPDQTIEDGESFQTFDLDTFLTELDGNNPEHVEELPLCPTNGYK